MERDDDDDIPTPDTSRSNSIDEDEENSSLPSPPQPTEEITQIESSPSNDTSTNVTEQIRTTLAMKRATFITSSSSSSESETDFVALDKSDFNQNDAPSINVVSC
ncbi:unnamed protein product [Adineta steineri]|uniref:Uncharacterized protein n=1 Tax=Adineta steineri TaxID=433720 RepID=A0A820PB43_9BILA|nr:unnamed protein product [Adineta steineri]CAF4399362.1 unnamed protein product [Adineta steineri]